MTRTAGTIEVALTGAASCLAEASETPRLDAEILLASVLGVSRAHLYAHPERSLDENAARDFDAAVARRSNGEPVAYITGIREFWSMPFKVTRATLIPRPETELLVGLALAKIPIDKECRILDLGTGSGAIAVAIARERPKTVIDAIDSSPAAVEIAKENAALNDQHNIRFLTGNWTEPVAGETFDLVVSNPPYVCDGDPALEELAHEPKPALVAGPTGLDAIQSIARLAKTVIAENGRIFLEHGADQGDAVAAVLRENGWADMQCFTDLAGHPRVTTARIGSAAIQDQP